MKVKDLKARSPVDEITIKIEEKMDPREVRGGLRVCDCSASDDTGVVTLTLWNDECDKVNQGDMVTIKKGWVNEYQGKLQLSAGKFGELTVSGGTQEENPEVLDAVEDDII